MFSLAELLTSGHIKCTMSPGKADRDKSQFLFRKEKALEKSKNQKPQSKTYYLISSEIREQSLAS